MLNNVFWKNIYFKLFLKQKIEKKLIKERIYVFGIDDDNRKNLVLLFRFGRNNKQHKRVIKIFWQRSNLNHLASKIEGGVWATKVAVEKSLPVGKVLFKDTLTKTIGYPFVIKEYLVGKVLPYGEEFIKHPARKSLLKQIGGYLSRLHSISSLGWGFIDGKGRGNFNTWKQYSMNPEIKNSFWYSSNASTNKSFS